MSAPPLRLLVVDDSPAVRTIIKLYLSGDPYMVAEADSVERALKLTRLQAPAIILADYMMPGGSGLELFEKIRDEGKYKPALLLMTASLDPDLRKKAEEAGAHEFVAKPVTQAELRAALTRAAARVKG